MTIPKNYIIFQCYGQEHIFQECLFALLSLAALYKADQLPIVEIWIYTDKPQWFENFKDCPLQLQFKAMNTETIQAWKGKINFVHRIKIAILIDFTQQYTGRFLYVDTDTVFINRIEPLFEQLKAGKLLMHVEEGIIEQSTRPVLQKLNTYLQKNNIKSEALKPIHQLAMWNAGVLGFNTAHQHLLLKVLEFTDREYPKYPKHIIEQFAFSIYFQQTQDIKMAAPYILHYWNLKEFRHLLSSFFTYFNDANWEDLIIYSKLLVPHVLLQEKSNFYSNRSIINKIRKIKWKPINLNWYEEIKKL